MPVYLAIIALWSTLWMSPSAVAACGDDILPLTEASESQTQLAHGLAQAGLDEHHEVILDTTAGVVSLLSQRRRLEVDVPFAVIQHDYREGLTNYGHAIVTVKPVVNAGALNLRFMMSPRDFYRRTPEEKVEIRREMASGNLRVLKSAAEGVDPDVDVLFGLSCEPSSEIAAFLKNDHPYRNVRLAIPSEGSLIEGMGVFEALHHMRADFPADQHFFLRPTEIRMTPHADAVRVTGALKVVGRPHTHALATHVSFYAHLYRTLLAIHPELIGAASPPMAAEATTKATTAVGDRLRKIYENAPRTRSPNPTLETFRLRCPGGELIVEGYETGWRRLEAFATAAQPAAPAQPVAPEQPVAPVELPVAPTPERVSPTRSAVNQTDTVTPAKSKRGPRKSNPPRRGRRSAPAVDAKPAQE